MTPLRASLPRMARCTITAPRSLVAATASAAAANL